jgi:two-component system C4-dicarboxylate transport sensor histidine kinase DctB
MDERRRAESDLHKLRDDLVQANKLAVLGQVAAGVAHEINQPVAAIRTYADNADVLLDRNEPQNARKNLGLIAAMTERIGVITDELRAFSRKTSGAAQPISLEEPIAGALLLVGHRARQQRNRPIAGADIDYPRVIRQASKLAVPELRGRAFIVAAKGAGTGMQGAAAPVARPDVGSRSAGVGGRSGRGHPVIMAP